MSPKFDLLAATAALWKRLTERYFIFRGRFQCSFWIDFIKYKVDLP